jgi:hypothetical protein
MAEVEFRDGIREIPDYMADMMSGIETFKMTYEEAIKAANAAVERRFIDNAVTSRLREHFGRGLVR